MQEENGRLRAENGELKSRQEELERELAELRAPPDDRRRTPSNLEEEVVGLRKQLSQTLSQKMLLEQENNDLINALAVEPPQKPTARSAAHDDSERSFDSPQARGARENGSSKGEDSPSTPNGAHNGAQHSGGEEDGARASRHLRTTGMEDLPSEMLQDPPLRGDASLAKPPPRAVSQASYADEQPIPLRTAAQARAASRSNGGAGGERPGETPVARRSFRAPSPSQELVQAMHDSPASWTEPAMWISDKFRQPVHGVAVNSGDTSSAADTAVVSWDGSCSLLRAAAHDGAIKYSEVWSVHPATGLYSVAFGSNSKGSLVGVACMDHACYVLDPADGSTRYTFRGHSEEVNALHFQPRAAAGAGELLVASGSDDTSCLVWAPATGKSDCIARLTGHSQAVYGVRFHPLDGSLLATVAFDRLGKIWDLRSGQCVLEVEGHSDDIIGLDFAPSGTLLATGSDDCTCRVWDLRNLGNAAKGGDKGLSHLHCLKHKDEVSGVGCRM